MGVTERKEREKTEMRELITAAAMKMFLEDGYAKTSIRGIADAIEYSPGTIYLYFKDKDELLYEIQADAYGRLLEVFQKEATSLCHFIHCYTDDATVDKKLKCMINQTFFFVFHLSCFSC
ncbi:transcriptional regulator, TetR family [Mucilaginibacter sp. OK268]|uniref:TetR/AcrR family transcriptional regulator n=1 Tax=Mucilaginibacter sp. OK268 TaxID=1881048 RepID=UPI000882160D|nr:TetR/AcrR family transcriptional regulator [Mucilaginibacter sp. OK268]SDP90493.1 transcriptional regulator, TetR family [Mucilaginibacter sp. OK268]